MPRPALPVRLALLLRTPFKMMKDGDLVQRGHAVLLDLSTIAKFHHLISNSRIFSSPISLHFTRQTRLRT